MIAKNLGDTLVASNCSASNTQGGGMFGGDASAFPTQQGQVGFAEALCFPDGPGRSIWVRLTLRPFGRN